MYVSSSAAAKTASLRAQAGAVRRSNARDVVQTSRARAVGPGATWDFSRVPVHAGPNPASDHAVVRRCGDHGCSPGGCRGTEPEEIIRRQGDDSGQATRPAGSAGRPAQARAGVSLAATLRSPGTSLDDATRRSMQARLGHDFSGVRIHTDTKAAESAAGLHAAAYTVGSHIAFGTNRYSPQTAAGRRLLVHELVHVIQQQGQRDHVSRLALGDPADAVEAEAEAVAADVEARQAAPATGRMPGRQPYALRVGAAPAVRRAPDGQESAASMSSVARTLQLACVVRKGGCPQSRDAGIPEQSEIESYNRQCREEHPERGYNGPDIYPTDDE